MKPAYIVIVLTVIILILGFSSFYTINEGERGVVLTNGRVTSIRSSGMHFKIPFFQTVERISTRTHTEHLSDVAMYSYDQQTATLALSVTYHIRADQIQEVYTRYNTDGIFKLAILPRVNEVSKTVFGQFTAARAIQERGELNRKLTESIQAALADIPVVIENIQIENVDFSNAYEQAVEQAARAKADVERAKSELARVEQEAQQKVKNAQAEADAARAKADADAYATRAKADAEAYSVKIRGEADAEALHARGKALQDNPRMIELIQAERWSGVLPTTMVPGATLPFINLK